MIREFSKQHKAHNLNSFVILQEVPKRPYGISCCVWDGIAVHATTYGWKRDAFDLIFNRDFEATPVAG